ncbi:hypothetical protein ACFLUY_03350 [Chloroflexota bacterium]
MREAAKLTAFILLIIGTLGLIVNEFISDWGSIATLTFAAVNIVGLAILTYTFWVAKKET